MTAFVALARSVCACLAVSAACCALAMAREQASLDRLVQQVKDDPAESDARLDGCVRLHHLWKRQLLAAAGPAASRESALVETVFEPNQAFWAAYLGDRAAFLKWSTGMKPLADDPRLAVPIQSHIGDVIVETTRRMEGLTARRACGDWFIVYGPGWTNMGGLGQQRMVLDVFGLPSSDPVADVRFAMPHELSHLLFDRARDASGRGTLLFRMIDEGLAAFVADEYWGVGLSPSEALGYSQEEWSWAAQNEDALWREAQPHLASTDRKVLDRFSSANQHILPGAPGKAGYFLGFRMIERLVAREGPQSWRRAYDMPLDELVSALQRR